LEFIALDDAEADMAKACPLIPFVSYLALAGVCNLVERAALA
jgi:hypothetical protein